MTENENNFHCHNGCFLVFTGTAESKEFLHVFFVLPINYGSVLILSFDFHCCHFLLPFILSYYHVSLCAKKGGEAGEINLIKKISCLMSVNHWIVRLALNGN